MSDEEFDYTKPSSEQIDFSDDVAQPIDPEHLRLADVVRDNYPHLLSFQIPKPDDFFLGGALVAEVDPVAMLQNIRWLMQAFDAALTTDTAQSRSLRAKWEAKREQFLGNEGAVLFNFLTYFETFVNQVYGLSLSLALATMVRERLFDDEPKEAKGVADALMKGFDVRFFEKQIKLILDYKSGRRFRLAPMEGSPLAAKVFTFLMEQTTRNKIDGSFKHPTAQRIVDYVNGCPELLERKRKVLKGGNKRRLFTKRTLYSQLKADGCPLPVIKKQIEAIKS